MVIVVRVETGNMEVEFVAVEEAVETIMVVSLPMAEDDKMVRLEIKMPAGIVIVVGIEVPIIAKEVVVDELVAVGAAETRAVVADTISVSVDSVIGSAVVDSMMAGSIEMDSIEVDPTLVGSAAVGAAVLGSAVVGSAVVGSVVGKSIEVEPVKMEIESIESLKTGSTDVELFDAESIKAY